MLYDNNILPVVILSGVPKTPDDTKTTEIKVKKTLFGVLDNQIHGNYLIKILQSLTNESI